MQNFDPRILQIAAIGEVIVGAIGALVALMLGETLVALVCLGLFLFGVVQFYLWSAIRRRREDRNDR